MSLRVLFFSIICLLSFEQKIFAQIKLDGQFKNWTAQNTNINGQQVCYAVSSPVASDPKGLNRAESRIFVSFRPNDKIQNEISVTSGYNYKASSRVNVAIDKKEFKFETEDNYENEVATDFSAFAVPVCLKTRQHNPGFPAAALRSYFPEIALNVNNKCQIICFGVCPEKCQKNVPEVAERSKKCLKNVPGHLFYIDLTF